VVQRRRRELMRARSTVVEAIRPTRLLPTRGLGPSSRGLYASCPAAIPAHADLDQPPARGTAPALAPELQRDAAA
jgi:hypothetical protein